jgi:hypothetical protein
MAILLVAFPDMTGLGSFFSSRNESCPLTSVKTPGTSVLEEFPPLSLLIFISSTFSRSFEHLLRNLVEVLIYACLATYSLPRLNFSLWMASHSLQLFSNLFYLL